MSTAPMVLGIETSCDETAVAVVRGYEVLPEAAFEVIEELTRTMGVERQSAWRQANQVEFQRRITLRQHTREAEARRSASRLVFCDRGLLDGMAYCRLAGVEWPEDLRTLAATARYAARVGRNAGGGCHLMEP